MIRFHSEGPGGTLRQLDVRPDDTDAQDYIFSPSLSLLPEMIDPRVRRRPAILDQKSEGACVGFALAAVINMSLGLRSTNGRNATTNSRSRAASRLGSAERVSQRMLYEMARRYDEWTGEVYEGSSLRGGMKGWHKHGVCSEDLWPYVPRKPESLTQQREEDARRRPLGAYYRVIDTDASHLQAAIVEADAVLASAWVHVGWRNDHLAPPGKEPLSIRKIPFTSRVLGLHAFALIGYGREGFIVQNSWGEAWGTGGLAVLSYEDWMENRQDAWVARPGPETWDSEGSPRIFTVGFVGKKAVRTEGKAGTEGLEVPQEAFAQMINTGDRGALSTTGRLRTEASELPRKAALVRSARSVSGYRNVVLYAHGGLVSEEQGARTAGRLWMHCRAHDLLAYFFVWETGIPETLLGSLQSRDDGDGPLAEAPRKAKGLVTELFRDAQRKVGEALAPVVRVGWHEMHERAEGASTEKGGAFSFAAELFRAMEEAPGTEPFRVHLLGHSAGAIYLARLYEGFLRERLEGHATSRVVLGSIQFFAPALSISLTQRIFVESSALPLPSARFCVYALSHKHENRDGIGIYPSSLLTYVADHLESDEKRVPMLGIAQDLTSAARQLGGPTVKNATHSERHGDFDEDGNEVFEVIEAIARGRF